MTARLLVVASALLYAADAVRHRFTVGAMLKVPKSNVEAMTKRALQVSDTDSPEWGKYITNREVHDMVGVPYEQTQEVAMWLSNALAYLDTKADTHVTKHGDVVTATTDDFISTYKLGALLMETTAPGNKRAVGFPTPPDSMEMMITPVAPLDLCSNGGHDEDSCHATAPFCEWKYKSCSGLFFSWMCWVNATHQQHKQWHCLNPQMDDDGIDAYVKSGGKRRKQFHVHDDLKQAAAKAAKAQKEKKALGFFASAKAGAFQIGTSAPKAFGPGGLLKDAREANQEGQNWESVELTWKQSGVFHTRVIPREMFDGWEKGTPGYLVGGIENFRRVSNISVCLNFNKTDLIAPDMGCICNDTSSGLDKRLGRKCQWLIGRVPLKKPVDFIFPQPPMSITRLQRECGIVTHGREAGEFQATGKCELVFQEFIDQTFSTNDTNYFRQVMGMKTAPSVPYFGERSNSPVGDMFSGEGSLDIQIGVELAPEANPGWWAVGPYFMEGFAMAYMVMLNDMDDPPLVHSGSWGDNEDGYPKILVDRIDYEIMKTALRGITMILATGDDGLRSSFTKCDFIADLIGTSEWVTTVGATQWVMDSKPYCRMSAVTDTTGDECSEPGPIAASVLEGAIITTSSFISLYRKRPAFQEAAVKGWLDTTECAPCATGYTEFGPHELKAPCRHLGKDGSPWCDLKPMVQNNRIAPDIVLPGSSYPTVINNSWALSDGTSASAPAWGALVAKMNAEQARRGQPPMGFMNTWLYKVQAEHPDTFVDVTVGDTGSTVEEICDWGWRAQPGWDPAAGLGVPVYDALFELLPKRHEPLASTPEFAAEASQATDVTLLVVALSALGAGTILGALATIALRRKSSLARDQHYTAPLLPS